MILLLQFQPVCSLSLKVMCFNALPFHQLCQLGCPVGPDGAVENRNFWPYLVEYCLVNVSIHH